MRRKTDIVIAAVLFIAFVLYLLPLFFEPARQLYSRLLNPLTPAPDFVDRHERDLTRLMRLQAQYEQHQDQQRQLQQLQQQVQQMEQELELRAGNKPARPGVAAEISARHPLTWNTVFTLRFPPKAIVRPGDCVISKGALVGRIHSVQGNTAQVHTLLHEDTRLSALLQGSKHFCSIEGGSDSRELSIKALYFPRDVELKSGDLFVSAGYGHLPAGLRLGRLVESKRNEINQTLTLRMLVPLEKLRYCLILPGEAH